MRRRVKQLRKTQRRRRLGAEQLEDRRLLVATLDLIPDASAGTVSEEGGTTVITVDAGAVVNVTAQIVDSDADVLAYQLNLTNSAAELGIGNYVVANSDFTFAADEVLDSTVNDYFVSSGRISDVPVPPARLFGKLDVTAPNAPGDYTLTSNFTTGTELTNTLISDSGGGSISITDFGDLIIRVAAPAGPEASLDLIPDAGAGTVTEENGTTVITVTEGTTVNITAQIVDSDADVLAYQLNLSNSAAELGIGNYVVANSDFTFAADEVLDSTANDYFVSSGRISDVPVPPARLFGTFDVTAPSTPGDYTLTSDFTSGTELTNTLVSDSGGAAISITDFGDLIIRIESPPPPTVTLAAPSAASIAEGDSPNMVTIAVNLSEASTSEVTVPFTVTGTATDGSDFSISTSPVTLAAGVTTANVTITVTDDTEIEASPETVIVTLGTPTGADLGTTTAQTVTITDNDALPTVSLGAPSTATIAEGDTPNMVTIAVNLSEASTSEVTVPFTVTGTATDGSDFSISTSPVTLAAGVTTANVTITVTDDSEIEASPETVIVTLGTPTGADLGTTTAQTVTITDNDALPSVSLAAPSVATIAEGDTPNTVTIAVNLSEASTSEVTVPFTVTGTATDGSDFAISTSPVTLAAGVTTANVTITVTDDSEVEASPETVIVTLGTPTGADLGTTTSQTVTITDNDVLPTVTLGAPSSATITEGDSPNTVTIPVSLSAASSSAVTVPFTVTGTAGSGDFSISTSPVTFAAGATTANLTITVTDDALDESDETVVVTLGTPTGADLGTTTSQTVTIIDDDAPPPPTVSLSASTGSVAEDSVAALQFTANLSVASTTTVTVPFTLSGTASNGNDYSITSSPLTFAPGATSVTVSIDAVDDGIVEGNETVVVTLGTPSGADLGSTTVFTGTITDANDFEDVRIIIPDFVARPHVIPGGDQATAILFRAEVDTVLTVGKIGTTSLTETVRLRDENLNLLGGSQSGLFQANLSADGIYALIFDSRSSDGIFVIQSSEGYESLSGATGTNILNRTDVNADGESTALDALVVINQLSRSQIAEGEQAASGQYLDVNMDGVVTASDALGVINQLARENAGGEGEQYGAVQLSNQVSSREDVRSDDSTLTLTEEEQDLAVASVAAERTNQSQAILEDPAAAFEASIVDELFSDQGALGQFV